MKEGNEWKGERLKERGKCKEKRNEKKTEKRNYRQREKRVFKCGRIRNIQ